MGNAQPQRAQVPRQEVADASMARGGVRDGVVATTLVAVHDVPKVVGTRIICIDGVPHRVNPQGKSIPLRVQATRDGSNIYLIDDFTPSIYRLQYND